MCERERESWQNMASHKIPSKMCSIPLLKLMLMLILCSSRVKLVMSIGCIHLLCVRTSVINFCICVILLLSSAITKFKTSRVIMCCHYEMWVHCRKPDLNSRRVKSREMFLCVQHTKPNTYKHTHRKHSINIVNGDSLAFAQSYISNESLKWDA